MTQTVVKTYHCDNCNKKVVAQKEVKEGDKWLHFEKKFFNGCQKEHKHEGHVCSIQCFSEMLSQDEDYMALNWANVSELLLPLGID